jgi:hypothetical protein
MDRNSIGDEQSGLGSTLRIDTPNRYGISGREVYKHPRDALKCHHRHNMKFLSLISASLLCALVAALPQAVPVIREGPNVPALPEVPKPVIPHSPVPSPQIPKGPTVHVPEPEPAHPQPVGVSVPPFQPVPVGHH